MDTRSAKILALPSSMRERLRVSAIHMACCICVATLVLALVFAGWYPPPLDRISGLATVLAIMLAADVTLGPLITLLIFDRTKQHLKLDLAIVVLIQLSALTYGIYTVYEGRPAHLVFVKDRFEVVAPADIRSDDRDAGRDNPAAAADVLRPKWVAARIPTDIRERQTIMFESLREGRDMQHRPRLYEPYAVQARAAAQRAGTLDQLRTFNGGKVASIDALPKELNTPADTLGFLPLKGPQGDATVIIRRDTGEILRVVDLSPWN